MNKRIYIEPKSEVLIIEVQSHMMTTSPGTEPGIGVGEADGSEVLTNRRRRGKWGDLWAEP